MTGHVVQVNISQGGIPKRPVAEGYLTPLGIEGDACAHPNIHGGAEQAVLLIAAETIEELAHKGYAVYFGALGENITTRGLDPRSWRVGDRSRAGEALIGLTRVRVPCSTIQVYGDQIGGEIYDKQVKAHDTASPRWGLSGFYARVIEPGRVRSNDIISLVATPA